jgi:hypothetical protein
VIRRDKYSYPVFREFADSIGVYNRKRRIRQRAQKSFYPVAGELLFRQPQAHDQHLYYKDAGNLF